MLSMGDPLLDDPAHIVLSSLCEGGVVLRSFGIDTDQFTSGSAAHSALGILQALATQLGVEPTHGNPIDGMDILVQAAREELDTIELGPLAAWLADQQEPVSRDALAERFWCVFAPNSCGVLEAWEQRIASLRRSRLVILDAPEDADRSEDIHRILFTSNILLTPAPGTASDEQGWFYDHPALMGSDPEQSEIVHGLAGLNDAIAYEKARGTIPSQGAATVVLSVSTTHESIRSAARDEVRRSIAAAGDLAHLRVYVFTEDDTSRIIEDVLAPAANCEPGQLAVFGVDGAYGRHYTFLKAIAALWHVAVDRRVDRTFKIDLDQVFPQDVLVAETSRSALELLGMARWGATAHDAEGHPIDLGMCAGALVNHDDIEYGLFTPDVVRPTTQPSLSDVVFRKAVPQSLSTEAEMLDRGDSPPGSIRQRVHVTGGTSGITVAALRKHHPFTPSFISRAEDQAFILSVLGDNGGGLRAVHLPGLFMRHDKHTFASAALDNADIARTVGDYERTLLFTGYTRALDADTSWLAPFTTSFVSDTPVATSLIGLLLEVISRSTQNEETQADDLLTMGTNRMLAAYRRALAPGNTLDKVLAEERASWDRFYEAVDVVERSEGLQQLTQSTITRTRIV